MYKLGKQFKVVAVSLYFGGDAEGEPEHGFEIGTVVTCVLDDGTAQCLYSGMAGKEVEGCDWREGEVCDLWVNDCDLEEVNND